eukprot:COSAG04_NODE_30344_length_263_cov_0.634146_1_plen_83_part_10
MVGSEPSGGGYRTGAKGLLRAAELELSRSWEQCSLVHSRLEEVNNNLGDASWGKPTRPRSYRSRPLSPLGKRGGGQTLEPGVF